MTQELLATPVKALKTYYASLGFLGRLFFPNALKIALESPESLDINVIYTAFASSNFFHRLIFASGLGPFFEKPAIKALASLFNYQTRLFIHYSQERIINPDQLNTKIDPNLGTAISALKNGYTQLNPFQRFFFPSKLSKALKQSKEASVRIVQIATHEIGFLQRLLFPNLLKRFFTNPAVQHAQHLIADHTLPKGKASVLHNLNALKEMDKPDEIASILACLNNPINIAKAQRNLEAIRNHIHSKQVIDALVSIHSESKPIHQAKFNLVIRGLESIETVQCIEQLKLMGLLEAQHASSNIENLLKKSSLGWIKQTLALFQSSTLFESTLEKQALLDAILQHSQPYDLFKSLETLRTHPLFTRENVYFLTQHINPNAHVKELIKPLAEPSIRSLSSPRELGRISLFDTVPPTHPTPQESNNINQPGH